MASVNDLAGLVDLERYPIDRLDSPAGVELVERCRAAIADVGAVDLERFLLPAAIEPTLAWARANAHLAYRTASEHNIYFTEGDASAPADHPLNRQVRSAKAGIAYNEIPADLPLRRVYESPELTSFVGAAVELTPIYRHADELGALNIMVYGRGDELGWHFDNADFVVTLMIQPAVAGGTFEFVPRLRCPDDENLAGVKRLLQGDGLGVRTMSGTAGTLALFRGHFSPHRVTPVEGERPRINATLAYAAVPDARLSGAVRQLFYGKP